MAEVNKGGRPKKLHTAEEKREAANAASRESRRRKRQAQQVGGHSGFQIQLDPLSILQPAGPKGITAPDQKIQAEGFGNSSNKEQQQRLESNLPYTAESGYADKPLGSLSINAKVLTLLPPPNQSTRAQRLSRSQSVTARITPPTPDNTAVLAEEDNEVADTDRVAQWQLTASTHSLSSVHESPRSQLAESAKPALLLEEEDGAEDADQVGEIGDISGTAEVSTSGSWHGAFDDDSGDNNSSDDDSGDDDSGDNDSGDNDSGDNDNGGDSDGSNSVRPALPLTDNSLYSELGGEAESIKLSDDIDWAAHSNTDNASNSDDGPEDQRAMQADSSEHTVDDENDRVDQEQHTRAAAAQLKMAWNKRCTCDEPPHAVNERGYSLAQITRFWQRQVSPFATSGITNYPLDLPEIASRNKDPNDHRHIPWQSLLAGGDENPPKLSFLKSERRFKSPEIQIQRRWDIDSFIARATTLAAHQDGFDLAYRPPFLRRITQNPRIRIQGHQIHKLKQLRLGHGLAAAGFGYDCHVFFPHMAVKDGGETHLSDREQAVWVDHIVLPALKLSCPPDVYQHHPHSFAEADAKAKVKQECFITGTGQPMDIRYIVPESCLNTFWAEVQRLSYNHTGNGTIQRDAFRDPFLVISGHGLKLFTKRDTFDLARNNFLSHLNKCFNTEQIPAGDCWLDLGMEDTPVSTEDPSRGVTLMWKQHCLDNWVKKFACPDHDSELIETRHYHWALTRDSGSANVELRQTNSLRRNGGIAYNKAYNVNKEMFATPFKDYSPFQNSQFEALGYSQELLERWYSTNSVKGMRPGAAKRRQLLEAYTTTKQRLSSTLRDSKNENYGVRQEYRITVELLRALEEGDVDGVELPASSAASSVADGQVAAGGAAGHTPYWVLPTDEVNAFAAAEMNRWLFGLEVIIGRVSAGHDGRPAASQEEQLVNGVMVSALVRVLRMSTGTDASSHPSMWLGKRREREREGESEASDDDVEGERSRRRAGKLGLNLRACVKENGMAWFPVDLIHWNITPTFTRQAIKCLALAANAFQKSFHKTLNIQRTLSHENAMFQLFREYLRTSKEIGIKTGAQLSVQSYIQEVFGLLADRWTDWPEDSSTNVAKDRKKRREEFMARAKLEDDEALGLRGLSWIMIFKLIGGRPRIVGVRQSKAGGKTRNGKAHFARYDTGLWKDKVFALFAWDDEREDVVKKRGWHNAAFRVLTRRLHSIVVEEVGELAGHRFLDYVKDYAGQCLWAIPQYDYDKLSVMHKVSKHHSREAREEISLSSALERTNWLVPQMSEEFQSDFSAIIGHYSPGGPRLNKAKWKAARSNLIRGLHTLRLGVYSSEDKTKRMPLHPQFFCNKPELKQAGGFAEDLNEYIAEQEAESEDEVEEV